jgi:hypothetical protein
MGIDYVIELLAKLKEALVMSKKTTLFKTIN